MKLIATTSDGQTQAVEIERVGEGYRIAVDQQVWDVDARTVGVGLSSLLIDGVSYLASISGAEGQFLVDVGGELHEVRVEEASHFAIRTRGGTSAGSMGQTLMAPLPGKITHVAVTAGAAVNRGDTLVVIEAMKMENELKAATAGTVREVRVTVGQAVNRGDVLVVID